MTSASGNRFCPLMLKVERKYVEYVNIYISFPFCHEILIHVTRFVYSRQRIKPEVCTRSLAIRNHHPDEVSCHKRESRIFAILNVPFFFVFRSTFPLLRRHDKETTTERDIFFSQLQSNAPSVTKVNRVSSPRDFASFNQNNNNSMRFHRVS